jgi:ABC-2 type transport system ATP-binding protein
MPVPACEAPDLSNLDPARPVTEPANLGKAFVVRRRVGRLRRTRVEGHAVSNLSFTVRPGRDGRLHRINGAASRRRSRCLTGILLPSASTLRITGIEPAKDRIALARRIGVVFGERTALWWDLPLRDSFGLLCRIPQDPRRTLSRTLSSGRCSTCPSASFPSASGCVATSLRTAARPRGALSR